MNSICEVIGWMFDESNQGQVLIREQNGELSSQDARLDNSFGEFAIQTGAFRRGNPIIDPVTQATLGYEMERISSAVAVVA